MHTRDWRLVNFGTVEALPAALARARGNAAARLLARADWLVRRSADGRYLAAVTQRSAVFGWHLLAPASAWPNAPARGVDGWRAMVEADLRRGGDLRGVRPMHGLRQRLAALGLSEDYGERAGLPLVPEPCALAYAGRDRYRRPLFLRPAAARAWARMRAAARADGILLDAISGYRGHAYQLGIFARKRARGQAVADILRVNAAPGYSEHHGGHALDIGTPGEPPAEETFEATPAFEWLCVHAGRFGFVLSYPRDNPHGIVYEPWHWRFEARNE